MISDGGGSHLEASVETRLRYLEERVKTLEALVGATPAPPQPFRREPFPSPAQPREATPPPRREPVDLEELLGGRVLGWVGGIAVVLAAVFFLVMAVHNGWIDEATRVVLAFVGSTVLLVVGVWLYERKGQTQAARAAAAAGFAALYASDTTATTVYHLVSGGLGLALAGLTGVAATVVAVRWDSREVAGIGIVGALLAPVLVDAGTSSASLVFMALALVGSIGVLIWRRWSWLAVLTYIVSAPQAASCVCRRRRSSLRTPRLPPAAAGRCSIRPATAWAPPRGCSRWPPFMQCWGSRASAAASAARSVHYSPRSARRSQPSASHSPSTAPPSSPAGRPKVCSSHGSRSAPATNAVISEASPSSGWRWGIRCSSRRRRRRSHTASTPFRARRLRSPWSSPARRS